MRPYLWAVGSIWCTWFAALVATSIHAHATGHEFTLGSYLAFYLGPCVAVVLTVVSFAAIAAGQCWDACDGRHEGR